MVEIVFAELQLQVRDAPRTTPGCLRGRDGPRWETLPYALSNEDSDRLVGRRRCAADVKGQVDPVSYCQIAPEPTLGIDPLPNLVQLVEAHGVRVLTLPVDTEDVDAFSVWHDAVPYVLLATSKTPERSRFELAHELGHLVLHSRSTRGDVEREADAFAAAFLMPPETLRTRVGREPSAPEIIRAKKALKVSAMALNRSLHDAGRLSDWSYRQNCIRLTQMGYRTGEPDGIARERSRVFRIVLDTLRIQGIGTTEIAAELGITARDVHDYTFGLAITTLSAKTTAVSPLATRPALRVVHG